VKTVNCNGSSGGLSLEEVCSGVVAGLRLRRLEIEETIFAHVVGGVRDTVGVKDAGYMAGLRATVSAVVEYGLAGIDMGVEHSGPVPWTAILQAQQAVRLGVGLDTVLCRYIAGHKLLVDLVTREAETISSERGVLAHVVDVQGSLLERLMSSIICEYLSQVEGVASSSERRRGELVQGLLAGTTVDSSFLGYEMEAWHIGVIATGAKAERALQTLAADIGYRLLAVQRGNNVVWGWFGGQRRLAVHDLERILLSVDWSVEVAVAVGELARGIDGWRQTHWQARETLKVLRGRQGFLSYADAMILALVLQNDLAARSLRSIYLAPLGPRHGQGMVARRTLRAYFKADGNAAEAANELGVTAKTVRRRVHEIEQRIGRLLSTCRAELEIALRLEDLEGTT
jgi:PucR C-terminal helix-turn-helix domain/GGDEF-like domain